MSEQLTRDDVLEQLAAKLEDSLLSSLFPAFPPENIRRLISERDAVPPQPVEEERQALPSSKRTINTKGQIGQCRLFTDGASRGNPGEAGAGAVLLDGNNRELLGLSQYLGRCTNNVAEYKALLLGLEQALRLGCKTVDIFLDSELIVRQILGQYKVKNETLKPLYAKARKHLAAMENWTIQHVPRADNARADELANRGIDEKQT